MPYYVEAHHKCGWDWRCSRTAGLMAVRLKILQKQFLEMKGSDLWSAICEENTRHVPSPCHIKLAKSEVDHDCLLLILVNETGEWW